MIESVARRVVVAFSNLWLVELGYLYSSKSLISERFSDTTVQSTANTQTVIRASRDILGLLFSLHHPLMSGKTHWRSRSQAEVSIAHTVAEVNNLSKLAKKRPVNIVLSIMFKSKVSFGLPLWQPKCTHVWMNTNKLDSKLLTQLLGD